MKPMKRTKATFLQIQIVLQAIVETEGWDVEHASISRDRSGGWRFKHGLPVPSQRVIRRVRSLERRTARETRVGVV